jgi:hypothetical protein
MIDEKNLIALIWASNECYTDVVDPSYVSEREVRGGEMGEEPYTWKWAKLEFDLKKGTWRHGKKHGKIGNHFDDSGCGECWNDSRYGLIGIYDKTNIEHLKSMTRDAQSATEDRHRGWDD